MAREVTGPTEVDGPNAGLPGVTSDPMPGPVVECPQRPGSRIEPCASMIRFGVRWLSFKE
jgi:hypothetical protein